MNRLVENFEGWKKLNEAILTWTTDGNSKKLFKIFKDEYLPTLPTVGKDWKTMTYGQYAEALKNTLKAKKYPSIIEFFTKKGYKQPTNAAIKKMQEDMMKQTGIKTFQNEKGEPKPLNDGTFGIGTADTAIRMEIKRINDYFVKRGKKDVAMTVSDKKYDEKDLKIAGQFKSDSTNVQTGVKGQPIK